MAKDAGEGAGWVGEKESLRDSGVDIIAVS